MIKMQYKGTEIPTREINVKEVGNVLVSNESAYDLLKDDVYSNVPEAVSIDSEIWYYANDDDFTKGDEELAELVYRDTAWCATSEETPYL